jgi:hypothetical protein
MERKLLDGSRKAREFGVNGEVHSVPLRVIAQHDDSDAGVKAGDTIYILHYEGEGYNKVWHDGEVVDVENFSGKAAQPKATVREVKSTLRRYWLDRGTQQLWKPRRMRIGMLGATINRTSRQLMGQVPD